MVLICTDNFHGAIPHKQAGRHQVSPDFGIDLGVITVVPRVGDYPTGTTHSGRKECYRRCSVENTPDPSNGVGITPPDLPSPVQGVGDAGSGFVRYGVQQTPSPVCFTPTRYSGSGSGRQVNVVDGDVRLCVPPFRDVEQSGTKSSSGQAASAVDSAVVAPAGVVTRAETVVYTGASGVTKDTRSVKTDTHGSRTPEPKGTESACLPSSTEVGLVGPDVAERIRACQRPSTRRVYEARVETFREWCSSKGVEWKHVTQNHVLNFLKRAVFEREGPVHNRGIQDGGGRRTSTPESLRATWVYHGSSGVSIGTNHGPCGFWPLGIWSWF